jgi:hypothetical protein
VEEGLEVEQGVPGEGGGMGADEVDVAGEEVLGVVECEDAGYGEAPVAALGYCGEGAL